jgi:hypothetical protein
LNISDIQIPVEEWTRISVSFFRLSNWDSTWRSDQFGNIFKNDDYFKVNLQLWPNGHFVDERDLDQHYIGDPLGLVQLSENNSFRIKHFQIFYGATIN